MRPIAAFGLLLFALLLGAIPAFTQGADSMALNRNIVQDPRVDLLLEKHIQINQTINTREGYRIQVFSESGANSKSQAQTTYDELQVRYPERGVYLSFKSPNYKVRIGDFRTRLDAQRFLIELTVEYPNAFIITDQIILPKPE